MPSLRAAGRHHRVGLLRQHDDLDAGGLQPLDAEAVAAVAEHRLGAVLVGPAPGRRSSRRRSRAPAARCLRRSGGLGARRLEAQNALHQLEVAGLVDLERVQRVHLVDRDLAAEPVAVLAQDPRLEDVDRAVLEEVLADVLAARSVSDGRRSASADRRPSAATRSRAPAQAENSESAPCFEETLRRRRRCPWAAGSARSPAGRPPARARSLPCRAGGRARAAGPTPTIAVSPEISAGRRTTSAPRARGDRGDLVVVGRDHDAGHRRRRERRLHRVREQRPAGQRLQVLARNALGAAAGGDDGENFRAHGSPRTTGAASGCEEGGLPSTFRTGSSQPQRLEPSDDVGPGEHEATGTPAARRKRDDRPQARRRRLERASGIRRRAGAGPARGAGVGGRAARPDGASRRWSAASSRLKGRISEVLLLDGW